MRSIIRNKIRAQAGCEVVILIFCGENWVVISLLLLGFSNISGDVSIGEDTLFECEFLIERLMLASSYAIVSMSSLDMFG